METSPRSTVPLFSALVPVEIVGYKAAVIITIDSEVSQPYKGIHSKGECMLPVILHSLCDACWPEAQYK